MFQNWSSTINWSFKAIVSFILALIFFISCPSPVLAQNKNPFQVVLEGIQSLFAPRTTKGAPVGRVRGGAGRGRCPTLASLESNEPGIDALPLSALVPTISNRLNRDVEQLAKSVSSEIVWSKTTEAYPSFWFYIPYVYEESELEYAKFVILDEDKHIVTGPIFFQLPDKTVVAGKPSLAKFTLPRNEKPLVIGKQYNWYFSIVCNERKPSRNPSVTGWIQRVGLRILAPKDYMYYAKQGIWYDTVTRLAESRLATTQAQTEILFPSTEKSLITPQSEIEEDWEALLKSFLKLSDEQLSYEIANAPMVELSPVLKGEVQ
ncbi:DUF928 domain-containing protein [Mastigocladopsis repens]|uniref:DUF928 domain-containing protein n=1 Tax=Mastigocladopsis repens TaxID=221287 RepID=UPI0003121675|nr:DUF928 domain-containing protein [Mastigocladopsis repens]